MKRKIILSIITFAAFAVFNTAQQKDYTNYVNPFIGTGGHGHTFPGATVPFGMVQLSPDNPSKGWDWTSGYNYADSVLLGFSHTHLSGTGVGDLYDILVMPFTGSFPESTLNEHHRVYDIYYHKDEFASPGYYKTYLTKNKITAELTATDRCGLQRYKYNKAENAKVLLDLGYAQNFDAPVETHIKIINDKKICGYRKSRGWTANQHVYFVMEFSAPFTYRLFADSVFTAGNEVNARKTVAEFSFNSQNVMVKTGISSASIDGAEKNLIKEIPGWNFEQVKAEAEKKWNDILGRIQVTDNNERNKKIFYTALYHSYIAPNLFTDENNEYFGADGKVHKTDGHKHYTLFSLWDTFRALHPLLTITKPEIVDDLVKSLMDFYNESGLLPTWDLWSHDTNVMIGYHAVPVMVDAYLKKLTTVPPAKLYEAVKKSAMQDNFGIKLLRDYKYIPSELELEAVSKVLEYSFDDWCIAQMADKLGDKKDAKYFAERANYYKNIFDKKTGFMRGKDKNGKWVEKFNPFFVEHRNTDYTEANAWQYTFHVLQDEKGLINLFGSEKRFVEKLDSLFTVKSQLEGSNLSPDISGLIGQYAHGNEPCHHVPYLYSFTKQSWKAQEKVAEIRKIMYGDDEHGLVGNDDCGQMSAWYVFSALGFYPVNPADGKYWFGTPLFAETTINASNGKVFKVVAKNVSEENKYIKKILLNGKELKKNYILHNEIMKGGEIIFEMTNHFVK